MLALFLKGILTGILVSLPLGPMAILVIQRTANRNFKSGFYTGLGVAFTDSIWALFAGFSVTYIISFLREYQSIIQIIGAIILFYLGYHIFKSHPISEIRKNKRKVTNPMQCFLSAILITLSNPITILAYIAVFASTNIVFDINQPISALVFTLSFLLGAVSWWTIITYAVNKFRHHFNLRILWWFNKISGAFVIFLVIISSIIIYFRGNPAI